MGCGASSSCPAGASLDCGAAARAREERYRIEERDMQEALNPKLKQIRLAPVRIANMWRRADMDGTGDLGMEEIGMILVDVGHALTRAQLEKVMEVVDKDGQGQVSREEFTEWYKRMLDTDFAEISEQQEASRSGPAARGQPQASQLQEASSSIAAPESLPTTRRCTTISTLFAQAYVPPGALRRGAQACDKILQNNTKMSFGKNSYSV